jgi:predicted transcriptional regulator
MAKPETLADHLSEEDAAFIAAVEEGIRSLDEGRSVPYEEARRWMLSWGTDNELPPPKCGEPLNLRA